MVGPRRRGRAMSPSIADIGTERPMAAFHPLLFGGFLPVSAFGEGGVEVLADAEVFVGGFGRDEVDGALGELPVDALEGSGFGYRQLSRHR